MNYPVMTAEEAARLAWHHLFFPDFLADILNNVYLCTVTTLVYSPYFCYEIKSFASQSVVRLSTFACFLRRQAGAGLSV